MILQQTANIKISKRNKKHYENLGYGEIKYDDVISVNYKDIPNSSKTEFLVKCDYCGKEFLRSKLDIERHKTEHDKTDYCKSCAYEIKRVNTCLNRFGVEYPQCSEEIRQKTKKSNLEKYGVENISQSKEIREKIEKTSYERYGFKNISSADQVKQKRKKSNLEKYGVEYISQSKEVKEKIKKTNLIKYGVEYPSQSPEIREKMLETFCKNGTINSSRQEKEVYLILKDLYDNVQTSYIVSRFVLDIFLEINEIKIDVEYDGRYWHQDKRRDLIRDKIIQKEGFKTLRIRSDKKIPNRDQLVSAINELINTDKKTVYIEL